eukprot:6261423-Amphidinium_carterae.1
MFCVAGDGAQDDSAGRRECKIARRKCCIGVCQTESSVLDVDSSVVVSGHGEGAEALSPETIEDCHTVYQHRCCFCGMQEGNTEGRSLSVAHIRVRMSNNNQRPCKQTYVIDHVKNTLLLCKNVRKVVIGSCHDEMDNHHLTLAVNPFLNQWVLLCFKNTWHVVQKHGMTNSLSTNFPIIWLPVHEFGGMDETTMPFRRGLALRLSLCLTLHQNDGSDKDSSLWPAYSESLKTLKDASASASRDSEERARKKRRIRTRG